VNWDNTKTKNGVAIFSLENPYLGWFSIHKSMNTFVNWYKRIGFIPSE